MLKSLKAQITRIMSPWTCWVYFIYIIDCIIVVIQYKILVYASKQQQVTAAKINGNIHIHSKLIFANTRRAINQGPLAQLFYLGMHRKV